MINCEFEQQYKTGYKTRLSQVLIYIKVAITLRAAEVLRLLRRRRLGGYFYRFVWLPLLTFIYAAKHGLSGLDKTPFPYDSLVFGFMGLTLALASAGFFVGFFLTFAELAANSPPGRHLALWLLRIHRRHRHLHLPMLRDLEEYETRGRRNDCNERR